VRRNADPPGECMRQPGFSLIELLVALGILATTLVMVVGVFLTVTRATQKSLDLTAGTVVAQSILSREIYEAMSHDTSRRFFFNKDYSNEPWVRGTERLNQTVFTYLLYANTVMNTGVGNRVKKVDAVVWWWNEEAASVPGAKAGYGFLRSEVTRLVNENSRY
jgi:prepilin-type N-terminal cleavage/methylation domain-containing protein